MRKVGRMVLDRNPDNFFAETEQVAFGTMNMIPGIDTSNDPLLQGRHHSYFDTQLSRLGGPNFHEIPINSSVAQVHNNQRDGMHRQAIPRGRVAYEPNSLGGGCPFQAGMRGFVPFPQPVIEDKVRGKPEKFADHFTQARLFFESQTRDREEAHHRRLPLRADQGRRPGDPRARHLDARQRLDRARAAASPTGIGIAVPARAAARAREPGRARGDGVAGALADGAPRRRQRQDAPRRAARRRRRRRRLAARRPRRARRGRRRAALRRRAPRASVRPGAGDPIHVEVTMETAPAVLWDGVVVPGGDAALARLGQAVDFVKDQYRHCKTILVLGAKSALVDRAMLPATLPDGSDDPGLVMARSGDAASAFIAALARHRHFERETDPPGGLTPRPPMRSSPPRPPAARRGVRVRSRSICAGASARRRWSWTSSSPSSSRCWSPFVVVNAQSGEKKIQQKIERLYSAEDPAVPARHGRAARAAGAERQPLSRPRQRRPDLPGDARGDPRRPGRRSPSRPTSTGRARSARSSPTRSPSARAPASRCTCCSTGSARRRWTRRSIDELKSAGVEIREVPSAALVAPRPPQQPHAPQDARRRRPHRLHRRRRHRRPMDRQRAGPRALARHPLPGRRAGRRADAGRLHGQLDQDHRARCCTATSTSRSSSRVGGGRGAGVQQLAERRQREHGADVPAVDHRREADDPPLELLFRSRRARASRRWSRR